MRISRMIQAVEAHAEGEPGRVITGGMPHLKGASVFEKMQDMARNHDDIRLQMLREPRGNPGLCCNAVVPPCHPEADMGFIIFEQTEYPPMSGSQHHLYCDGAAGNRHPADGGARHRADAGGARGADPSSLPNAKTARSSGSNS